MKMSIGEKKILFAFGCPDYGNTVIRLKHLAMLTVDPSVKKLIAELSYKLLGEGVESWYRCFYYNLRMEMESYFHARRIMHRAENSTIREEDFCDEADKV